jgi:type I restriction enzyme S subunit
VQPHSYAYNPSRINIGSIGINETGGLGAVSSIYVVVNPKDINFGYYLWHLLKTKRVCESIKMMSSGTVRQSLAFKDFASIKVALPAAEIIQKFFEIRNEIYKNITTKENQILLLTNLRDTLLPRLISGQLRIGDVKGELEMVSA